MLVNQFLRKKTTKENPEIEAAYNLTWSSALANVCSSNGFCPGKDRDGSVVGYITAAQKHTEMVSVLLFLSHLHHRLVTSCVGQTTLRQALESLM